MRGVSVVVSILALWALAPASAIGRDALADDGSATDQYWRPELRVQGSVRREPDLDINAVGAGGGLVLPRFDIDTECHSAHANNAGANECIRDEQIALNAVRAVWDDLAIDAKIKCRQMETYRTVRYRRIQACVVGQLDQQHMRELQQKRLRFNYRD